MYPRKSTRLGRLYLGTVRDISSSIMVHHFSRSARDSATYIQHILTTVKPQLTAVATSPMRRSVNRVPTGLQIDACFVDVESAVVNSLAP